MPATKGAGNKWLNYIMRTTGPQQFYSFGFTAGQNFNVPKNIPLNQPLAYIHMEWVGRIVIGTANFTSVSPESLLNIIAGFKLNGTHAVLGNQTPFNMSGASLFKIQALFNIRGNSVYIGGVRIADAVINSLAGIPTATFGNTGTYDVTIHWTIPVFPLGLNDSQAILYTYNAAMWNQSLQLTLQMGDATSFGVPGTATTTFTAYGSGAGSPTVNLLLTYISLGPMQNSVAQAIKIQNDIAINSVLQSVANTTRLALLQNQKTTAVVVKTGVVQVSNYGTVYGSLSDSIMEQAIIRINNNPIRNLLLNAVSKEFYGFRMNLVQPGGYLGLFFDDGNPNPNAWTAIQGQNFPGGAQFDVAANIISAAGGNVGDVIQEYIIGTPVTAS